MLLSIIAWAGSLGMFVLIRRVGVPNRVTWAPDDATLLFLWGIASVLFGTVFWLLIVATETRAFRSQPFGLLILAKSFAVLAAAIVTMVIRGAMAVVGGDMTLVAAWSDDWRVVRSAEMGVFLLYL